MRFVNDASQVLVTLVLAGGLVWAAAVWKSRRRTAALVAIACALQLTVRLLWLPAVRILFGPLSWSSSPVQRFFNLTASTAYVLSLAFSLGLLVYAALGPASRES